MYGVMVVVSQSRLTSDARSTLTTVISVENLLHALDRSHICQGNPDDKFQGLQKRKGFLNNSSKYM